MEGSEAATVENGDESGVAPKTGPVLDGAPNAVGVADANAPNPPVPGDVDFAVEPKAEAEPEVCCAAAPPKDVGVAANAANPPDAELEVVVGDFVWPNDG